MAATLERFVAPQVAPYVAQPSPPHGARRVAAPLQDRRARVQDRRAVAPLTITAAVPAPRMEFTFDVRAGALRRGVPDDLASTMVAAGLDVSWSDDRSGWFGLRRRFTVRGPRAVVQHVIGQIGVQVGWQHGAVALPI